MSKFHLEISGSHKKTDEGNDSWWFGGGEVAWSSLAAAKAGVLAAVRSGRTIGVLENGKVVRYIWHPEDITDNGLVLETAQISSALISQGNWNAATNTPDITATTIVGHFWIVDTIGTTNLGGIDVWGVNDWAIKTATGWAKVNNTDKVISIAGKIGIVTLNAADITDFTSAVNSLITGKLDKATYTGNADDIIALITGNTNSIAAETTARNESLLLKVDKVEGEGLSPEQFTLPEKEKLAGISAGATPDQDLSSFATSIEVAAAVENIDLSSKQDLLSLDDSYIIDEDGLFRPNTNFVEEDFTYDGSTKIFTLLFTPYNIVNVFVRGIRIKRVDWLLEDSSNLLELFYDLAIDDEIIVQYKYVITPIV